jgi:hypothetical protein
VDRSQLFSTREDKFGSVSRNGNGIGVWDAEGILFVDYLEEGKTVTKEYYSNLLTRLDKKICEKRPVLQKEKNHLSSGQCTRPQKCFGNGKIMGSADLAPSDFCLFPKLKLFLAGQRFSSHQEAIAAI